MHIVIVSQASSCMYSSNEPCMALFCSVQLHVSDTWSPSNVSNKSCTLIFLWCYMILHIWPARNVVKSRSSERSQWKLTRTHFLEFWFRDGLMIKLNWKLMLLSYAWVFTSITCLIYYFLGAYACSGFQNFAWMPMPTGNGENPQFYGQWTVENSQKGLCAKTLRRQRILSAWILGLFDAT